jgi:DNA-binding MarR family transcriptional regulator
MSIEPGDALELLVADVYELSGALRRHGEELAARVGQTQARWQLLSVVSAGRWTAATAARRLGISRQAVQRVADDLAAEGHVRYVENPEHKRSPIIEITPSGRADLKAITAASRKWRAGAAGALSAAEIERARRLLRSVLATLD